MPGRDDNACNAPPSTVLGTPLAAGCPPRLARTQRFNGTEIVTHWVFGGLFLLLMATGLALYHPQWRNWDLSGVKLVKETHLTLAVLLVLATLTAAAWDGWRSIRSNTRAACRWGASDWGWLSALAWRILGRRATAPPQGRFNAGQKLNIATIAGLTGGLVLTGALMWPDWLLGPGARALAYSLHGVLMLLSVPVLTVHIVLATLVPATRPSLRGMIDGTVPTAWQAQHHPLDPGPSPDASTVHT